MMPTDSLLAFEVRAFVLCALAGVACAFLYDFFKIIRRTVRARRGVTFILDFLFWLCAAFVMFGMLLFANHGQMRIFEATAVLLGAAVYFFSVSNAVVSFGTTMINKLLHILFLLLKITFFPVRWVNRYLIIPLWRKFAKKIRKIQKKRLTIRFFWFRINKGLVFLKKYHDKKAKEDTVVAAKTKAKKKNVGFMKSRFMTVLLCCAIIWVVSVVWGQQADISNLKAEENMLKSQIEEQEAERLHIENQMKTQDEKERVEQDARNMGMVKPNEVVFVDVSK